MLLLRYLEIYSIVYLADFCEYVFLQIYSLLSSIPHIYSAFYLYLIQAFFSSKNVYSFRKGDLTSRFLPLLYVSVCVIEGSP